MNDFSATPELVLLPAVDVAGGKAVRLTQGEAGTETFHGDPVDWPWPHSEYVGDELGQMRFRIERELNPNRTDD